MYSKINLNDNLVIQVFQNLPSNEHDERALLKLSKSELHGNLHKQLPAASAIIRGVLR